MLLFDDKFYFACIFTACKATTSVILILFETEACIASVAISSAVVSISLLYFLLYFFLDHLLVPLTQQHLLVLTLQRNVTGFSTIQIYVNYQRESESVRLRVETTDTGDNVALSDISSGCANAKWIDMVKERYSY